MEFGIIGVIVAVIAAVYCIVNHFRDEEAKTIEADARQREAMLQQQISEEKQKNKMLLQEALQSKLRTEIDRYAATNTLPEDYTTDDLAELATKHKERCKIQEPNDVTAANIERIIKITVFAEEGLLDLNTTLAGDPVRIVLTGGWVPISDDELEKMLRHDYDFILNDPENN
jgi:hypothetical protein